MADLSDNYDGQLNADDIDAMDNLIANAAAATDAGDYEAALLGFSKALKLARQIFGEIVELTELENTIEDINKLLGE